MAPSYYYCFPIFLLLIMASSSTSTSAAKLSSTYYQSTCPNALTIIKSSVASTVTKEAGMGASLLRLHFHDCFVHGCDASVLLDDTVTFTGEKTAPPNIGSLRGFEVIDDIKSRLEAACPGVVSCADILTVAARDSVVPLGGSDWEVATALRASCPFSGGDNNLAPLDLVTPQRFDNQYYKDLVAMKGLLHSDQQLYRGGDGSMDFLVRAYASNDSCFRTDFANAMIKMGNLGPPPGTSGQVRTDCRKVNN